MLSKLRILVIPLLQGVLLGVLLLTAFLAGFFFHANLPVSATAATDYSLLHEVKQLLATHYLRELPETQLMEYAAIRGMVGALEDPYTFLVDPPVAQSESDVLAGQYGGIGVQVQYAAEGNYVLYPFADGPAAEAGVADGDILLAIDGTVVELGTRLDDVDQAMRGEVVDNNGVTIRVLKHATDQEAEYTIPFAVIAVPSVVWRPLLEDERIGYVQLIRFTSRTPEELQIALDDLLAQGIDAWVLDMRNNSGGLLQEAIETADELLDDGVIVYESTRSEEKTFAADAAGLETERPLVVLVNHGTASAAELVAGAIQDNERGIVIGQTTYGKGSVQLIFPLSDGASLHITSAEWFTPDKTPLDQHGLEPDISMIPAEEGRDVELGEAIRHLQQQLAIE